MDEKLDQLATQLQQLQAAHEALLSLVRRKQQALRLGQAELVSETCTLENEHVQRIAELEKQRQRIVGQITAELSPNAKAPLQMRQIAEAVAEPRRGQLLVLQQRLRQTMRTIERENEISRRAADGLLRHMQGIMQQVTAAMGGGTYRRGGDVASPPSASMSSISVTA